MPFDQCEDYEVGDEVIVYAPADEDVREDSEQFNAGWDASMDDLNGAHGVITTIGRILYGRHTYRVSFPEREDFWWWDPYWMERANTKEPVSDEDFDSALG